jgi:hypothetical protein
MSVYRTANRADDNIKEIVEALRKAGALVWYIGRPFDLLVRHQHKWIVLEVKNRKGKNQFTCQQQGDLKLLAAKEGMQDAVYTVHDVEEALEAVGATKGVKYGT